MRNLSLILFFLLAGFSNANAQIKLGAEAGLSVSNVVAKDENGNREKTGTHPGLRLGLTVDIPLVSNLYLQPAAIYTHKGFKQETGGFYGSANDFKVKAEYVQVPITIILKLPIATGHLLVGTGPYVGYGFGGSWTSRTDVILGDIAIGKSGDVIFRNDAAEGGNINSYTYGRPWDYGINFLAGPEFGPLTVLFNGQLGLANLVPEFSGFEFKGKLRNTAFGVSLGYKF